MNDYTVDQLTQSETYQNDPELRDFAYKLAGSQKQLFPDCTHSQVIEMFLSGNQAERVHKSWHKNRAKWMESNLQYVAQLSETEGIIGGLQLPTGVIIDIPDNDPQHIHLIIPRDGGLMTPKIKRLGGWWNNEAKCFVLPLTAAKSLPTILKNWKREYDRETAKIAAAHQAAAVRRDQERREREARWAAEREQNRKLYEQQKRDQVQAVAERVKIIVGEYKIGDLLNGKKITGFGKSWTERELGTWGSRGTRYDEACDFCHRVTVIDNETDLCEKCGADGKSITVCYAYFR